MTEQLSFAGIPPRQPFTDRLFFGIFPTRAAAGGAHEVQRRLCNAHRLTGKPFAPERFHATLFKVGDYHGVSEGLVRALAAAAATVVVAPFRIEFDRAESFSGKPGNLPLVLLAGQGGAELQSLHQALWEACRPAGLVRSDALPYIPHVTLLRAGQAIPPQTVEPIGWNVDEFVLVHSLLGQTRYIQLGRWPLRG